MNHRFPIALALFALAGCEMNQPTVTKETGELDPTPYGAAVSPQAAAMTMEAWRPAWWVEKPVKDGRGTTVAALGTDQDLLAARKKALEAASGKMTAVIGSERASATSEVPPVKADTIKLPDGQYRTFVLMTVPNSPSAASVPVEAPETPAEPAPAAAPASTTATTSPRGL